MSFQEVAARQLDQLAAGRGNLEDALKCPSSVYSRPRGTGAATTTAASEITDLTGGSSSMAIPGPQSIVAGKALAFAGPTFIDLAGVF
jgi:hypothetical protein